MGTPVGLEGKGDGGGNEEDSKESSDGSDGGGGGTGDIDSDGNGVSIAKYLVVLNEEVFDALVLLAAGSWEPTAISAGWDAVAALKEDMRRGRIQRIERLGFEGSAARDLSALHTRNFM